MPISIRTEQESAIAIATCSGVLRLDDALQGAAALWETPGWTGSLAAWDFRAAEFDVSSSDVRRIAQFILDNQPTPPPSKMAFITSREVDFGMARMFEAYRDDSGTAFQIFRDYDEAIGWLTSDRA